MAAYKTNCVSLCHSESKHFNGCLVYIIPSRFGPGRLKILEDQVVRNGGIIYKESHDCKSVTYVITEETVTKEDVGKFCKVEEFTNAKFLKCTWLMRSLKQNAVQLPNDDEVIFSHCEAKIIASKHNKRNEDELLSGGYIEESSHKSTIGESRTPCSLPLGDTFVDKFACAHSSKKNKLSPNSHITQELEKLASAYESKKDTWRAVGYQKAISAIKSYPKKIETWEEARSIRGVGERLSDKIKEILDRGELRKVKEICDNEETKSLQLFMGVWGAGATTANNWYIQGFRSLEDLRKGNLTRHQEIGLKYYEDFNERIPRSEVEKIEQQVKMAAEVVNHGLDVIVCGSYRRGYSTCGDVDILITHQDGESHINVFKPLLEEMKNNEFLSDDLVIQEHNGNQQKYLGVCKLPEKTAKHRRLDIIVVPYKEYAPALMYFTGSAHFNRSMRLLATKLGMSLSEHGLRKGIVRDSKNSVTGGILLDTPTEESIFHHLGLKYQPPSERNH